MIEAVHLTKSYGSFRAVDDLTFSVAKGEIVGFLGPNGAGKSTTLRMLTGFLGPTSGSVHIMGHDVSTDSVSARSCIGYMPEMSPLYPELRVTEYLRFRAELKLVPRAKRKAAVERALVDASLADFADVPIAHLSKGYRQRVGLADALVGSPPLLILDEPTAGLDPNQIREVRALIRRLGEEHTVLVSTHILSEVEAVCTRALVIARGRLIAQGTIDELVALRRSPGLRLVVAPDDAALALKTLRSAPEVLGAETDAEPSSGAALIVEIDPALVPEVAAERLVAGLVGAKVRVREIAPKTATLEQVFSELTQQSAPAHSDDDAAAAATEAAS